MRSVSAFAPASVGNVAAGFDVLGHAFAGRGDRVTLRQTRTGTFRVSQLSGCVSDLPTDERNTAVAAVMAMNEALELGSPGLDIEIDKGIPLASGMGGSAASAVAAVVAFNALLKIPLPMEALYPYALAGESVASGGSPGDNVGASLLGGLVCCSGDPAKPWVASVPVSNQLRAVIVRPEVQIETAQSRAALPTHFAREDVTRQMANLSGLLIGNVNRDMKLIAQSLEDVLVESHRAASIPGFFRVKEAAMSAGALGCSISGAGPSMFAWFANDNEARSGARAMQQAFEAEGFDSEAFVSPVQCPGASVQR